MPENDKFEQTFVALWKDFGTNPEREMQREEKPEFILQDIIKFGEIY